MAPSSTPSSNNVRLSRTEARNTWTPWVTMWTRVRKLRSATSRRSVPASATYPSVGS